MNSILHPVRRSGSFRLAMSLLTLLPAAPVPAGFYYVAPDGNDTGSGSLASPFASVQRAQQAAAPGDTVYLRGGAYKMNEAQIAQRRGIWAYVTFLDKSGTPEHRINYWAYRDERPVFDLSNVKPERRRVTAFYIAGSWIHIKGLAVTGVQVTITGHTQSICFDNEGSNNVYELLTMHDGQAIGFWLGSGSNNLVLNCDAYQNQDYTSEDKKGGNVDGFGFHAPKGSVNNGFRGCRAWFNSDDGFDCISAGASVTIEHCWAFYNGYTTAFGPLRDGNGFKAGGYGNTPKSRLPDPIPHHIIRGCVAVQNKASGFYANHHPGGNDWLNDTAYGNGTNFNLLGRNADNTMDLPGRGHQLKNNLGFKGRTEVSNLDASASDVRNNYFNLPVQVTDDDFVGLKQSDLTQPRQSNGDLPEISFLHLNRGSDLIDQGVDVGLPFAGTAPDLGAFEFGRATLSNAVRKLPTTEAPIHQ
jgi:Right handed beta helix region